MVSREIWEKHALMGFSKTQIELVLRTRAILYVFEKLTRACFSQIALETILLPIQTECNFRNIDTLLAGVFGCPTTVANVETVAVAPVSFRQFFNSL